MKKAFWVAVVVIVGLAGCQREESQELNLGNVDLQMVHKAGGSILALNQPITNPHGEPLTITHFAYYLSHLELQTTAGNWVPLNPVEYYLVNEKESASKNISIRPPKGSYQALRMLIGVDSTRNVSGVQSGALDPANGMFWSWNTGYIFAKLEGKSSVSTAPLQNLTYHIGGFRTGENALQTVTLNFPVTLEVQAGSHRSNVEIWADADAWFNAVTPVYIASEAFCMNPGSLAQKISANYARMFHVHVVNN